MFTAGLIAGGIVTATALWLVSGLTEPIPVEWRRWVVVAVAAVAVLRDAGVLRFPLPQNARQIPQDVIQRHLLRGSLQFGFELGTGVRTYVSASLPYVVAVALLLTGVGYPAALLAGAGFGLGRAATPLLRLASGDGDAWDRAMSRRLSLIATGGGTVLVVVFAVLAANG
ncbi:hypothetical protein GCM10023223_45200 [Stackebrandtia albiflava]